MRAPMRTRRVLSKLLLAGASLAVSLLVAELAVRLVKPQEAMSVDRGLYEPDPPRRYRLHPGYHGRVTNHVEFDDEVVVDSIGLRGAELAPVASPASGRGTPRAAAGPTPSGGRTLGVLAL